jgi:hypothetical protein
MNRQQMSNASKKVKTNGCKSLWAPAALCEGQDDYRYLSSPHQALAIVFLIPVAMISSQPDVKSDNDCRQNREGSSDAQLQVSSVRCCCTANYNPSRSHSPETRRRDGCVFPITHVYRDPTRGFYGGVGVCSLDSAIESRDEWIRVRFHVFVVFGEDAAEEVFRRLF